MSKRILNIENSSEIHKCKKPKFSIDDLLNTSSENDEEAEIDEEEDLICPSSSATEKEKLPEKTKQRPKMGIKTKEGNLQVDCKLEGSELWAKFYDLGTEMIITKSGRRMFPTVKVSFSNVCLDALYYVFLDVIPVDSKRYRYIYNKSAWLTAGKAEPVPRNRLYLHPDCPFSGDQLLKHVISFEKTKLTNNEVDKTGHLILNSMHKYQPRIHIVQRPKQLPLDPNKVVLSDELHATFTFPETQFMAVTAYQNQLITKLKIEKNPFAKGFRDPSGRSPDDLERPNDLTPLMFYQQSTALQQAVLQQYFSKTFQQINPSLISQMLFYANNCAQPSTDIPPTVTATAADL
ncbi:unnamed protein product [Caenorhabditis angaria]|uniref:T-box domain-containing protein n=1 Tax=Caenorhabditis angaria TaxID=860376 RepID=A0A9P1IFG6_9PELO|nr:unnamed protein product [Caenorhabditis angaria]